MNSKQILDKIARNLSMRGITAVRGASEVTVGGLIVSCVDADIQKPLGGVDGNLSPFLGIGVAAPGKVKIKGASGETSVGLIFTTEQNLQVLSVCCAFANNVIIEDGDSAAQLAELWGQTDNLGLGQ
jgi:hypothetical protein